MSCDLRGCVERLLRFALRGMRAFLYSICTIRLSGGLTPLSTQPLIPIRIQSTNIPLVCTHRSQDIYCTTDRGLVSCGRLRVYTDWLSTGHESPWSRNRQWLFLVRLWQEQTVHMRVGHRETVLDRDCARHLSACCPRPESHVPSLAGCLA